MSFGIRKNGWAAIYLNNRFLIGTFSLLTFFCISPAFATTAESYNPPWLTELNRNSGVSFHAPFGSSAYLEDQHVPWWQGRVAQPIDNYDASKLDVGAVRLDSAVDLELTLHRQLPGWQSVKSPTKIDNIDNYTGSPTQDAQTARAGQNAFFDLGLHPFAAWSADIGAEVVGNYDERYWFPVNDEHRMFKDDRHVRIVRGEIKYETPGVMIRGFEGVGFLDWTYQNDLFQLLPTQMDVQNYRDTSGTLTPRGGEVRLKGALGALDIIGGTEPRWGFGSGVYAKYDFPLFGDWENTIVFRNENIPFGLENPDERRTTVSYNVSRPWGDRIQSHFGLLYQPFRLNRDFLDVDNVSKTDTGTTYDLKSRRTLKQDALGFMGRVEAHPTAILDLVGLGYTYLGPVAGNKEQVDFDFSRAIDVFTFSIAYLYRQPVIGPEPLLFEGTDTNVGALISNPRGPDDPFWVQWDNRKAHIVSVTLVYDPTPTTPFFKFQRNVFDSWNLNPDEDATWTGAVQYRLAHYPTNIDRTYFFDENRHLGYDPVFYPGALASSHPLSSATGLLRWKHQAWSVVTDLSGGEAMAGAGVAYTDARFYKPTTIYMSGGVTVEHAPFKSFFRYGQDVWGPDEYHNQFGWTYHQIYQAGISATFLKYAEVGFRYVGTRISVPLTDTDSGAFNEYRLFLTYHFALKANLTERIKPLGRALPQSIPEVSLTLSGNSAAPIQLFPKVVSESGVLTWRILARNDSGETVKQWNGRGVPPTQLVWDGLNQEGQALPAATYRLTLEIADLYGNEVTTPAQSVTLQSTQKVEAAPVEVPKITKEEATKAYTVTTTPQGLKVTLSSQVLFDFDKVEMKASAKDALNQVIQLLQTYPKNKLRVTGYTDSVGSNRYNQKLSERRAQAVRSYLVGNSTIAQSRLSVQGLGKNNPIADNATEEGRQLNRRVEIDILK